MIDKEALAGLALAQSLYKRLGEALSTLGGADGAPNLRTEADDALQELYEQTGADRIAIEVNGAKVGTLSMSFTKPERGVRCSVRDNEAFVRWLRESDGGRDALMRMLYNDPGYMVAAATADGELPDGCFMEEFDEPARVKGKTLRVDAAKVAQAYADGLPGAVMELLGLPSTTAAEVEVG